jgi:hypothetical protein
MSFGDFQKSQRLLVIFSDVSFVRTGKKCIFNCFSRASFGCLDVRLIFQVDYNQNASKFTNRLEKQVGVLTLGLLIRLWNVGGC